MLSSTTAAPSGVTHRRVATRPEAPEAETSRTWPETKAMPEPLTRLRTGTGKEDTRVWSSASERMRTSGEGARGGWGAGEGRGSSRGWARIREAPAATIRAKETRPLSTFSRIRRIFLPRDRTPASFAPPPGPGKSAHPEGGNPFLPLLYRGRKNLSNR